MPATPPQSTHSIRDLITGFIAYLTGERKLSSESIRAYETDVAAFLKAISADGQYIYLTGWERESIESYLAKLEKDGYCAATIGRKMSSIRGFYRYLCRTGLIIENPASHVKTPIQPKTLPIILTTEEVERLLNSPTGNSVNDWRDRAVLELMYSAGLKIGELCDLDICDLDFTNEWVNVKSRRSQRVVPIGSFGLITLKRYLENIGRTDGPLFTNKNCCRLNRRSISKVLRKYIKIIGLEKKVQPSTLRHTFAVHLLNRGANLKTVQELLGHRQISTTQKYNGLVGT